MIFYFVLLQCILLIDVELYCAWTIMRPILHYDPYKGYQTKWLWSLKTIELLSMWNKKTNIEKKKLSKFNFFTKQKVKKKLNTLENVINNKVVYTKNGWHHETPCATLSLSAFDPYKYGRFSQYVVFQNCHLSLFGSEWIPDR